jgi:hypothetical protein
VTAVRDELRLEDLGRLSEVGIGVKLLKYTTDEIEEFTVEMFECDAVLGDGSERRALVACRHVLEKRGEPERFQTAWEKYLTELGVNTEQVAGAALPGWMS